MSKSKGNVIGADDMAERYGADTGRLFVLFAAPPELDLEWQDAGVEGMHRFLGRVYRFVTRHAETARAGGGEPGEGDAAALRKLHQVLRKVTADFETRWHFNTSLAAIMELMNELHPIQAQLSAGALREILDKLVLMLAPFVPYVTQELWEELGHSGPVFREPWPCFDAELAREQELEIPVQVNGKLRGRIYVAPGTPREALESRAIQDDKIQSYLAGRQIVRMIVVPDKLVNIVVKG
jgi:leucyl-tRNA synthetase